MSPERSLRRPVNVASLVAGVVCCGIALGWLLLQVRALSLGDLGWLLPTILIGAGVLGVGLSLQRSRKPSR